VVVVVVVVVLVGTYAESKVLLPDEKLLGRPAHSQRRFTVTIGQQDLRRVAEHVS